MGKRSAQAGSAETARGVRDQSRMAATRYEARGAAREPDGGCRDDELARLSLAPMKEMVRENS